MNFNKYKNLKKQYDVSSTKSKIRQLLKKLSAHKLKSLGRSYGKIVMWHRGSGVKRNYRFLSNYNFNENKYGIIRTIEYDPNRSTFISLIQCNDGSFTNISTPSNAKEGDVLFFNHQNPSIVKSGDAIALRYAPVGVPIYNLEEYPGSGPVYARSAGVYATLLTKDLVYGKIRLSSGEERLFDLNCLITMGIPSNIYQIFNKKYKAGTNRLLNRRPVVRGTAMNPIDHPHGGGAGKTAPGRPSVSPWGKLTKGVPTRNKKLVNKLIVKRK